MKEARRQNLLRIIEIFFAVIVGLVLGLLIARFNPQPSTAVGVVTGSVQCSNQTGANPNTIEGVWVAVKSGHSGFAHTTPVGGGKKDWIYQLSRATSSYSLHIGCGGSPQKWVKTWYSPELSTGTYVSWFCSQANGCVKE